MSQIDDYNRRKMAERAAPEMLEALEEIKKELDGGIRLSKNGYHGNLVQSAELCMGKVDYIIARINGEL